MWQSSVYTIKPPILQTHSLGKTVPLCWFQISFLPQNNRPRTAAKHHQTSPKSPTTVIVAFFLPTYTGYTHPNIFYSKICIKRTMGVLVSFSLVEWITRGGDVVGQGDAEAMAARWWFRSFSNGRWRTDPIFLTQVREWRSIASPNHWLPLAKCHIVVIVFLFVVTGWELNRPGNKTAGRREVARGGQWQQMISLFPQPPLRFSPQKKTLVESFMQEIFLEGFTFGYINKVGEKLV